MTAPKDDAHGVVGVGYSESAAKPQRAALGQSTNAKDSVSARSRQLRCCVTCGTLFRAARVCFRKCHGCARKFRRAQTDLVKQRTADGVRVMQLTTHLDALRTDDADTAAWLACQRTELGGKR